MSDVMPQLQNGAGQTPMPPTQQVYDLDREGLVLRTFFTDPTIANKMNPMLDHSLFRDLNNKTLIKVIAMFIRKHARRPTAQELVTGMESAGMAELARAQLMYICNAAIPNFSQEYAVQMLENFYQERKVDQLLMKQAELMHDGKVGSVRELIPEIKAAVNFSLHLNLGLNVVKDTEEAKRRLLQSQECIPSGINDIRFYTSQTQHMADGNFKTSVGGYYRKTLSLFIGQPNVGKSLILCSECAFAATHGYNCLYVTLELAEEYVWRRLAANLMDTPQHDVLGLSVEEIQARIRNARVPGADELGEIQVKSLNTTATPNEIETLIDAYEIELGKTVDFLVIDYIGIMKPSRSGHVSEQSMYNDGVAKAEQIRDICKNRGLACLSAVQFNRTGYKKLDAGMESVEGSSGYSETADLMVTITSDSVLRANNMLSHCMVKNRFGPNEITFLSKVDFTKMQFTSPTDDEQTRYNETRASAGVTDVPQPQPKPQSKPENKPVNLANPVNAVGGW